MDFQPAQRLAPRVLACVLSDASLSRAAIPSGMSSTALPRSPRSRGRYLSSPASRVSATTSGSIGSMAVHTERCRASAVCEATVTASNASIGVNPRPGQNGEVVLEHTAWGHAEEGDVRAMHRAIASHANAPRGHLNYRVDAVSRRARARRRPGCVRRGGGRGTCRWRGTFHGGSRGWQSHGLRRP